MPQDIVQIGPLLFSKSFFDILFPLIGVLIGGLITYWSTIALENRKWKREVRWKKKELERKAIEHAMEWINPIRDAVTSAQLQVTSFKQGHMDEDTLFHSFPDLNFILAKMDMPRHQIALLTWPKYQRGGIIAADLKAIHTKAMMEPGLDGLWECWQMLSDLQKEVDSFTDELENAYLLTLDET